MFPFRYLWKLWVIWCFKFSNNILYQDLGFEIQSTLSSPYSETLCTKKQMSWGLNSSVMPASLLQCGYIDCLRLPAHLSALSSGTARNLRKIPHKSVKAFLVNHLAGCEMDFFLSFFFQPNDFNTIHYQMSSVSEQMMIGSRFYLPTKA